MIDFGPPVPCRRGKGGVLKIKRGGAVRNGNSGNAPRRFHNPVLAIRDFKKPSKQHKRTFDFRHEPWPPRGPSIWDPRDPLVVAYQEAHR